MIHDYIPDPDSAYEEKFELPEEPTEIFGIEGQDELPNRCLVCGAEDEILDKFGVCEDCNSIHRED